MSFHIGKAEIRLSIGVFPLFVALIIAGEGKALAIAAVSLFLHELFHIVASRNLGFAVRRISIYPFGAVLHLDTMCAEARSEAIASLAGPVGSLVIASAIRLIAQMIPQDTQYLEPFIHTNAAIALINLLPAYPLDGGKVFGALLLRILSERAARTVSFLFTGLIALLLITIGILCIQRDVPAWMLFAIAPYLLLSACLEWKQVKPSVVAQVLARRTERRQGSPILAQLVVVDGSATIGTAMQMLSKKRFTIFRIRLNSKSIEADEDDMLDAASRYGYGILIKEVFSD